ncbi:hypothetical protein DMA11_23645 [Marinilabiliaceae bacterium JC017]|nr:hypothetical protein DMA11_23645 [Marinilabiliaceae bacterium JC017]
MGWFISGTRQCGVLGGLPAFCMSAVGLLFAFIRPGGSVLWGKGNEQHGGGPTKSVTEINHRRVGAGSKAKRPGKP